MFETLQEIKQKYGILFTDIKYEGYTDYIINVFDGKDTDDKLLNSISPDAIKLNICGIYHHTVTKNYAEMEKYYLMAIELGNAYAMYNLGVYHKQVTKNYAEMEKYYLMAIGKGNADAMNNLGVYHHTVTKNYAEMEKYYLMAIELGDASAIYNLGYYHKQVTKNYAEMEKYYLMAIGKGHANAMNNLKTHYKNDSIKLFASLNSHFDSKQDHTDVFLDEYCKLLKEEAVQSHIIQDKIKSECGLNVNANIVNKHLYEKYIQTGEKVETGAYATDFTIIATLTGELGDTELGDTELGDTELGDTELGDTELGKTYPVHSLVLNSEYFLHLLDSGFSHATSVTMQVSDFGVVDILLKYLYRNDFALDITKERLESIRRLADEFAFDALARLCDWIYKLNALYIQRDE